MLCVTTVALPFPPTIKHVPASASTLASDSDEHRPRSSPCSDAPTAAARPTTPSSVTPAWLCRLSVSRRGQAVASRLGVASVSSAVGGRAQRRVELPRCKAWRPVATPGCDVSGSPALAISSGVWRVRWWRISAMAASCRRWSVLRRESAVSERRMLGRAWVSRAS